MRTINLLLCFLLFASFSLSLYSQSDEKGPAQAELLKQFIGTWEAENGQDTVIVLTVTPLHKGLFFIQEDKANGTTYNTYKAVFGLSDDRESIIAAASMPNGTMIIDFGKFVKKNKYVIDRYYGNTTHAVSQMEWEFLAPESFTVRAKWRGEGMNWPEDWKEWFTFKRSE